MKKLRLDVESLQVESFVTERGGEPAGTVHGFHHTRNNHETCGFQNTCVAELTCFESCFESCKCVVTQPEVSCQFPCPTTTPI